MQSSDPAIYAAGDSASCQWAADQSRHWFQMRLWSQVGMASLQVCSWQLAGLAACRACSLQVAVFDAGLGLARCFKACAAHHYLSHFSGLAVHMQARAMGIYSAHCMVGVQDQVGCWCRPAAPWWQIGIFRLDARVAV